MTRSYDAFGRLARVEDSASGIFAFEYDLAARLLSVVGPNGTIKYTRDQFGRVKTRQVVGGPVVTYTYDAVGNVASASMPVASASMPAASVAYSYDALNRFSGLARGNGVDTVYSYDDAGRLLSIVHRRGAATLLALTYTYDSAGQRISAQTTSGSPLATQAANATYDGANRLLQRGSSTYAHDENGNLTTESTSESTTTYRWDGRNRLKSVNNGEQTTSFTYDFGGNLIAQADSGAGLNLTKRFVLDKLTNVAHQAASDGTAYSVLSGQSIDSHVAVASSNGQIEYGIADAINSTIATVDQSGGLISQVQYEPFAASIPSTAGFPFLYTGRTSTLSGLYYYRSRFYSSVPGRFVSEDAVFSSQSPYVYAGNQPASLVDPLGLESDEPFDATQPLPTTLSENPNPYAGRVLSNWIKNIIADKIEGFLTGKLIDDPLNNVFNPEGNPIYKKGLEQIGDLVKKYPPLQDLIKKLRPNPFKENAEEERAKYQKNRQLCRLLNL